MQNCVPNNGNRLQNVAGKKRLRVATDSGGLEGHAVALKRNCHVKFDHVNSSDNEPACHRFISTLSPNCKVAKDANDRSISNADDHDIYIACWPCQPYAKGGSNTGEGDPRGVQCVTSSLRLIKKKSLQW